MVEAQNDSAGAGRRRPASVDPPELVGRSDRIVELPDEPLSGPRPARVATSTVRPANPRAAWLLPPLLLTAIVAGVLLVMRGPSFAFAAAFGTLIGIGLLWVLVSALFPNRPDRGCPACGEPALVRLSRSSTRGLRCRRCDWVDEDASSFFLAEEEGPIEPIVLRERQETNAAP